METLHTPLPHLPESPLPHFSLATASSGKHSEYRDTRLSSPCSFHSQIKTNSSLRKSKSYTEAQGGVLSVPMKAHWFWWQLIHSLTWCSLYKKAKFYTKIILGNIQAQTKKKKLKRGKKAPDSVKGKFFRWVSHHSVR